MPEPTLRLSPRICRAARALLDWNRDALAEASGVPKPTISAFEAKGDGARLTTMNNRAVVEAFERAGLQLIPENGGGAGLRMRERQGEV